MQLDDFLSRFGEVVDERDGHVVPCPVHADSHPSLRVAFSDQNKLLLRCRAGCDSESVRAAIGMTWAELNAIEPGEVTTRAMSRDVPAGPAEVARIAAQLDGWASALADAPEALDYAARRFGTTAEDARRLGLGYAWPAEYDADGNITNGGLPGGPRVVVPFRDEHGVPRGFQARALADDAKVRWLGPASPEGASWAKTGYFPGASGWEEILITEGPGDALTANALGYDTIMIRGAGLASNPMVIADVARMTEGRTAVVAGDGDPSGRRFSSDLCQALAREGRVVKALEVPEGLDLTDWRKQDPTRFPTVAVRAILSAPEVKAADAALRSRDEELYPLTDLGNARFVRDYIRAQGSAVKFSPEAGFFLLGDGVWQLDKREVARAYTQEAADLVARIADELTTAPREGMTAEAQKSHDRTAKRWATWARHSQSSRGIDAAIRELQALRDVSVSVDDFDAHPHLLAARNGVINLRTGELQGHDPELLLTRRVDFDYDPAAKAPRWEAFLGEVFPDYPALPDYVRRLVGYGITGSTAEQCFAVLWGTGANGKSVFTDTLTEVFRELTVTTPFSTFEDRGGSGIPNDIAALKGARLVMAAEGEQGRPMAEAVLKRVTGRDLISARFMRREFFEFRPTFLLMLATNFKPKFRGQDEGLWRRVKLIPWARYFAPDERDHTLGDALLRERQGILAWAVRGAMEWFRNGLQDPAVIRDSTKEYREASDVLNEFIPGVYTPDPNGKVKATDVFRAFQSYADEGNYLDLKKWSSRALYSALEERGFVRKRGTGGAYFIYGIRRARQTDEVPDHAEPESEPEPRTDDPPVALYQGEDSTTSISGPSLGDVF